MNPPTETAYGSIEGLLFDLGGVAIDIDFERALRSWAQCSRLPLATLRKRFSMDDAYQRHERGEVDAAIYFQHLREMLELDADDAQIAAGWNAIFSDEISATLDCIISARQHLPCFAFTNSNPTHQAFWSARYPRIMGAFEQIFVSSELGLRKPEPEAFNAIATATGLSLASMLFFDDTEENVRGAHNAGLPAVHVTDHADVRRALHGIGVFCPPASAPRLSPRLSR